MSYRVGRVWPMTSQHVAHPLLRAHRLPVRPSGLVSDSQSIGNGVLVERILIKLRVELQHSCDEARPGVMRDKVADYRWPAGGAQMASAIEGVEAGLRRSGA